MDLVRDPDLWGSTLHSPWAALISDMKEEWNHTTGSLDIPPHRAPLLSTQSFLPGIPLLCTSPVPEWVLPSPEKRAPDCPINLVVNGLNLLVAPCTNSPGC